MAAKKTPPKPANGASAAEVSEVGSEPESMTPAQREKLIQDVQERADRLQAMTDGSQGHWAAWHTLIGSCAESPEDFKEAMRLGREWRESFRPKPSRRKAGVVDAGDP